MANLEKLGQISADSVEAADTARPDSTTEIFLSFSRFALSQPIFMVEVSKCPSQKVKRGLGRAHFDPSSSKSAIGPQSRLHWWVAHSSLILSGCSWRVLSGR